MTRKVGSPPQSQEPDCPRVEGEDARRFEFSAFGPAAMSYALLGQAWWQWDSEGHAFDAERGTVWVVVHDGLAPDVLSERFPVREETRCDHRYVELEAARAYLEDHIGELDGDDVPELRPVVERLERTRKLIEAHFR